MVENHTILHPWSRAGYSIEVQGLLQENHIDVFSGMTITTIKQKNRPGISCLTGNVMDQSHLTGILNALVELHLPILSVQHLNKGIIMKTKDIIQRSHRWIYHSLKTAVAISFALALGTSAALADGPTKPVDTKALAKASQNPVAALISVPFENNATFNNGPDDVFVDILNIKPVIPMGITKNWNLINRAIIPAVYQDDGFKGLQGQDLGNQFGLGDIVYQGFLSPKKPGKIIWGIGPEIHIPTGTDRLTSDQWSAGPAAVVLTMPGRWVIGALVSNVWNIGDGYNDAEDVSALTAQYFINYNFDDGWYVTSAPVITANWKADSGDKWTVPFGGGFGRVFKIGKQHVNMKLAAYYNVDAPSGSDDVVNLQFQCTFLFPK